MPDKHFRIRLLVEEANKVRAECYRASTELTEHSMKEARAMEARFEDRYKEPYDKYATLTYDEWLNARAI